MALGVYLIHVLGVATQTTTTPGFEPGNAVANLYGLNGTVAYTLYAENFPGSCWGEKINAAISHAIDIGSGTAIVQLPPGDLNVSTPIRFARSRPGDECSRLNSTRDIASVWQCAAGMTAADLPRGLTLRGMGGTTGNVYEGGTRLSWVGPPDNVVVEMPAPWHCHITRLTIHGLWVPGTMGIRYRAGWDFGTNGGKDNLFQDLNFEGLEIGLQIGDPLSPDLVGSVIERVECMGARHCFVLFGANVAEMHFNTIHANQFYGSAWLYLGSSGRSVRTQQQIAASPAVPRGADGTATVLTDMDGATEISWEQLPTYAQQHCPALEAKDDGPRGGAKVGGGGPTANIVNVVSSSVFCTAWLVESNGAPLRIQSVRNEGCNGIYLNNATHWPSNTRSRFTDMLIDVSATTIGGADGNAITYHSHGPLYIIGGSFHGPIATAAGAKVFNMGASFDNHNVSSHGCLLDGDDWRLGPHSPYVKADSNCTVGASYTGRTGHMIVAPPPSARNATVGFIGLAEVSGPQLFSMQDATSGSVRVKPGATYAVVSLSSSIVGKYQVVATADFNAGGVWAPRSNRTSSSFLLEWERPPPDDGAEPHEIDWEVRNAAWAGNPSPGPM